MKKLRVGTLLLAQIALGSLCLSLLGCDAGGTVEAHLFSPAPGEYTSAQQVTISCATPGSVIRYTVDGTAPTAETASEYEAPIDVSSTVTITAVARRAGWVDSEVVIAEYAVAPIGDFLWWRPGSALPSARSGHSAAAYGGYVYALGGDAAGARLDEVLYSAIGEDGLLGPWQTTTPLPIPNRYQASVANEGYLYVLGGNGTGTILTAVSFAPIHADGSLGSWVAATSLPAQVYEESCVVHNGFIYVFGGGFSTTLSEYAAINADGSLGAWNGATALSAPRTRHASVVWNDRVYLVGGDDGSLNNILDVHYAVINPDGSLGSWVVAGTLSAGRRNLTAHVRNGYLYVVGGSGAYGSLVESAQIGANGSLGAFAEASSGTDHPWRHASAMSERYLYVMGGLLGTTQVADVDCAKISE